MGRRTSFHHLDHEDEHWVIVDSGANKHYIARRDFLSRIEEINVNIVGIGDNKVNATAQGLFTGCLYTRTGRAIPFDSFAYHIPNANVSLFSVPQANWGDNDVSHHGTPVKGKHCMKLATGEEIPFEFCHETGLYWMKIRKADPKAVFYAEQRLTSRVNADIDNLRSNPAAVACLLRGENPEPNAYNAWVRSLAIEKGSFATRTAARTSTTSATSDSSDAPRGSGPVPHNLTCPERSISMRAADAAPNP